MIHRHRWEIVGREERAPAANFEFGGGLWGRAHDHALYGYTTLSLRCSICGAARTQILTGAFAEAPVRRATG